MLGEVGCSLCSIGPRPRGAAEGGAGLSTGVEAVGFEPTCLGFQSRCLCRNATVPSERGCRGSGAPLTVEFGSRRGCVVGVGCIDGIRTHNIRIKSPSLYHWATLQNRPHSASIQSPWSESNRLFRVTRAALHQVSFTGKSRLVVPPSGLEPAPSGLKVRRSTIRASRAKNSHTHVPPSADSVEFGAALPPVRRGRASPSGTGHSTLRMIPAPTVLLPSRTANRIPGSIPTGFMSSTVTSAWSRRSWEAEESNLTACGRWVTATRMSQHLALLPVIVSSWRAGIRTLIDGSKDRRPAVGRLPNEVNGVE